MAHVRGRGSLIVRSALVFDEVPRFAPAVHEEQLDAFRVDATVGVLIGSSKDLAQ